MMRKHIEKCIRSKRWPYKAHKHHCSLTSLTLSHTIMTNAEPRSSFCTNMNNNKKCITSGFVPYNNCKGVMHHWTSCTSVHIPFTSDLLNKLILLLYSIRVNSAEPIIAIGQLALALLESNIYWYFTTNWQKEKGDDIIMLNVCCRH